jgi:hypothetical protein
MDVHIQNVNSVAAWHVRAEELADWALARLVNRSDAWGGYYHDGPVTHRGSLSRARLIRHFRARHASDVLGAHTASAANLSRGGALDIDQHGDDPLRAEANRRAALHWYGVLARLGFRPLLYGSNGTGGYHLRVLLAEPSDAARVFYFLRQLTADHRKVGLTKPPEQFPKQADVRQCAKGLGNWIRLPGRHHKCAYWSEVWDGSQWRAGHDAIDHLLALAGDTPELVPDVPTSPRPPQPAYPVFPRRCASPLMNRYLDQRAAAYLDKLPSGKRAGEGRDDDGFRLACFLARDLGLADHQILPWLEQWDAKNAITKGKERLGQLLHNAHLYGRHPYAQPQEHP